MASILIVSIDRLFRALVGGELKERGHEIDGFDTIEEAIERLPEGAKLPDLILIEARDQNFNESLAPAMKKLDQNTIILVCAGAHDLAQIDSARFGIMLVVRKPATVEEVVSAVVKLLKAES